MNGAVRFNRKAWAGAITAPVTAGIVATLCDGLGFCVPGLESVVMAIVTATVVWAVPNARGEL